MHSDLRLGRCLAAVILAAGLAVPVWGMTGPTASAASLTAGAEDVRPDSEGWVRRVRPVEPQARLTAADIALPASVRLADRAASPRTVYLARLLKGVERSPYVLYGHQNDLHHKANASAASPSDTFIDVGDYPAVSGFDFQALEHGEFELTPAEQQQGLTLIEKMARICESGDQQGVLFTASAHMPNFAVVAKRGRKDGAYDYTGYTTPVVEGDVVRRIMPGGDLNECYRGYLDMMADMGKRLAQKDIPLIVRLFHENDGSWFWWGAAHCTPEQYVALYRYTVEYLRDVKGVHNFLYAYSPGGPVRSRADFLERYPGDAYVDIIGFDTYQRDGQSDAEFQRLVGDSLDVLHDFAARHHDKIVALTETGLIEDGHALRQHGSAGKHWFTGMQRMLGQHPVSYFMTWSNDDAKTFFEPFMVDDERGHELINEFVDFYNMPGSIFAHQLP